jgi:hypothetical protein
MIVNDLHVVRAVFAPFEADSPLPVDPNAVLSFAVSAQGLQAIVWKAGQVFKAGCAVQCLKAAFSLSDNPLEAADSSTGIKRFSVFIAKASDH